MILFRDKFYYLTPIDGVADPVVGFLFAWIISVPGADISVLEQ